MIMYIIIIVIIVTIHVWIAELLVTFLGLKVKTLSSTWRGRVCGTYIYLRRPQNVITPPTVWHFKWIHPVYKGFLQCVQCVGMLRGGTPTAAIYRYRPIYKFATVRFELLNKKGLPTKKKKKNKCIMLLLDVNNRSGLFNFSAD